MDRRTGRGSCSIGPSTRFVGHEFAPATGACRPALSTASRLQMRRWHVEAPAAIRMKSLHVRPKVCPTGVKRGMLSSRGPRHSEMLIYCHRPDVSWTNGLDQHKLVSFAAIPRLRQAG